MDKFLENIEMTKQIILYTTILSNNASEEWEKDAKKIIDLICESYKATSNKEYYRLISYDLSNLSSKREYQLMFNTAQYDDEFENLDVYYDIKGKALTTISQLSKRLEMMTLGLYTALDYENIIPYNSVERRDALLEASRYGDVELTVMAGIIHAIGIGGKPNFKIARLRFLQAAYWGYFPAFRYASYISKLLYDSKNERIYEEIYNACYRFMTEGITVIPSEYRKEFSTEANNLFSLVASIYFDVVILHRLNSINYSFIEVMLLDGISLSEKMRYVNHYTEFTWKDATNGIKSEPLNKFGFNI